MLFLPIQEHGGSFHFPISSSISFFKDLKFFLNFTFTSVISVILRYFVNILGYCEGWCFSDLFLSFFFICICDGYCFLSCSYPATFLKVFISIRSSLVEFLGSLIYTILSSENSKSLTSSFPIWIPLISICCLIPLARTSRTMLNTYGERGQPVFLILVESLWVSLHLIWYWLSTCCILLLLCLDMFIEFLISPRPLSWKGVGLCQRPFLHLLSWPYCVCLSVCLFSGLIFFYLPMLNHPWISGMKPTWSW